MRIDRRQFLAAALAGVARAQSQRPAPLLDRGFARVTKIADGVYATIANREGGPQCMSNGGVIAGRDAVLIVEGHMQPAGAALEVEAARQISKAPIRAAIDTHYHLDHSFGNPYYAAQRIPIMAHEQAGPLMKERYAVLKGTELTRLIAPVEQKLAAATDSSDKQHLEGDLGFSRWMYGEILAADLSYPTEPLSVASLPKTIPLGGITAVIEFQRGHSPTDLVIRVPERDVVFTGDNLFHESLPVTFDADMLAWRKVLDRFAGYGTRTQFVPGHGELCGVEKVRAQIELFDDWRAHAEKMIVRGAGPDEAARRYAVPARFQSYRIASWDFTVGGAMRGFYAGLKKG